MSHRLGHPHGSLQNASLEDALHQYNYALHNYAKAVKRYNRHLLYGKLVPDEKGPEDAGTLTYALPNACEWLPREI